MRIDWALSLVGERLLHTQEVTGSNPVAPTIHAARWETGTVRQGRRRTFEARVAGSRTWRRRTMVRVTGREWILQDTIAELE